MQFGCPETIFACVLFLSSALELSFWDKWPLAEFEISLKMGRPERRKGQVASNVLWYSLPWYRGHSEVAHLRQVQSLLLVGGWPCCHVPISLGFLHFEGLIRSPIAPGCQTRTNITWRGWWGHIAQLTPAITIPSSFCSPIYFVDLVSVCFLK